MVAGLLKTAVVVPNWDGADSLAECLDSLLAQSRKTHVIVVDNGSKDGSLEILQKYPAIEVIKHTKNKGFAGGVNAGFRRAIEHGADYVATLNNDAVADRRWLEELVKHLDDNADTGIGTCKLLNADGKELDSTGDYYTVWGLPYPRGRGEADLNKYDSQATIFGASGGASLYRVKALQEVGLFDEDFFAYYEDVDLSFRAQLAGWKIAYVPSSFAYHQIGATSSKIKGFATYQTMKNLQLLYYKNVPKRFLYRIGWRFFIAQCLFLARAFSRRQGWAALTGDMRGSRLLLKKRDERKQIQRSRKATDEYIWSVLVHDLPPNARALRKLRAMWRKFLRKPTSE